MSRFKAKGLIRGELADVELPLPVDRFPTYVDVVGDIVYVLAFTASTNTYLFTYDISDLDNPVDLDVLTVAAGTTVYSGRVILGNTYFLQRAGILTAIDISNPAALSVISTLSGFRNSAEFTLVTDGTDYLYVTGSTASGILYYIVDVSNPASMSVIGNMPDPSGAFAPDRPRVAKVLNNTIYAGIDGSSSNDPPYNIDISSPTSPVVNWGSTTTFGMVGTAGTNSMMIHNNRIFFFAGSGAANDQRYWTQALDGTTGDYTGSVYSDTDVGPLHNTFNGGNMPQNGDYYYTLDLISSVVYLKKIRATSTGPVLIWTRAIAPTALGPYIFHAGMIIGAYRLATPSMTLFIVRGII